MQSFSTSRRLICAAASVLAALALTAVPANAQAFGGCLSGESSNPFKPWLDVADYVPAPDGNFEAPSRNGRWRTGPSSSKATSRSWSAPRPIASLRLPASSSATTAPMCVGLEHPTLRLFAKRTAGSVLSRLRVEAMFTDPALEARRAADRVILSNGKWAPTATLPIVLNCSGNRAGRSRSAFRFTPSGKPRGRSTTSTSTRTAPTEWAGAKV